jgi:hypothetical protein
MELLNALNPCVCLGTVVKGLRGECLARAQCEPVQGQWNHVPRRPDGHGAVQWKRLSKKATLCLLLVCLECSCWLTVFCLIILFVCFAAGSLSVSQRCAAVPYVSVNFTPTLLT